MPDSSLDHLVNVVDAVADQLRELKTENAHLKEEIRRLEQELEGYKGDLATSQGEIARLESARKRIRLLAERALNQLSGMEDSGEEIDVTG